MGVCLNYCLVLSVASSGEEQLIARIKVTLHKLESGCGKEKGTFQTRTHSVTKGSLLAIFNMLMQQIIFKRRSLRTALLQYREPLCQRQTSVPQIIAEKYLIESCVTAGVGKFVTRF